MKIYIASKTKHAEKWRALLREGLPIISTWISEAGEGETSDWTDLWRRCIAEAKAADVFILYREEGEILRGAYIEMGAALAAGSTVFFVGPDDSNVTRNGALRRADTVEEVLARLRGW